MPVNVTRDGNIIVKICLFSLLCQLAAISIKYSQKECHFTNQFYICRSLWDVVITNSCNHPLAPNFTYILLKGRLSKSICPPQIVILPINYPRNRIVCRFQSMRATLIYDSLISSYNFIYFCISFLHNQMWICVLEEMLYPSLIATTNYSKFSTNYSFTLDLSSQCVF